MRRILFATAVIAETLTLAWPLTGTIAYFASRRTFTSQRDAIAAALREAE